MPFMLRRVAVAHALAAVVLCLCAAEAAAADSAEGRRERFAEVDGMRVRYVDAGRGEEALVFVHGWTCNAEFWRMQLPAFGAEARVIALDLPGHGRSDKPEGVSYSMDLFARSVEAVMRDAGVKRAVLVGHSMGTPVVRQFYRRYPAKTLALVAVDGALRPFAPRAAMEQFMAPMRANYREAAGRMVEGMLAPVKSEALKGEIRAAMLATPQHVAVSAMEGMMDEAIYKEDPIRVPVLAVHARSPLWGADYEQFVRRLAPDLDFRVWDGASHFLMMDRPDEFNRALTEFLAARKLLKGR